MKNTYHEDNSNDPNNNTNEECPILLGVSPISNIMNLFIIITIVFKSRLSLIQKSTKESQENLKKKQRIKSRRKK